MKNMMPAGTYFIGDLCYVMHGEWDEFCDLTIKGNDCLDGVFNLADGRRFATYGTAYGDGVYRDNSGGSYSVDAGLIGCILLTDIDMSDSANIASSELGRIYTFDAPFETSENNGVISFGDISINTDYDDSIEDEYYED